MRQLSRITALLEDTTNTHKLVSIPLVLIPHLDEAEIGDLADVTVHRIQHHSHSIFEEHASQK